MDKKKVIKFVCITYVIAWALQIIGSLYMVNEPASNKYLILGPLSNGLISMIPLAIFAVILGAWSIRRKKVEL